LEETACNGILNVTKLLPPGTTTVAGTDASVGLLLLSDTVTPQLGRRVHPNVRELDTGPVKSTCPTVDVPPVVGPHTMRLCSAGGMTVKPAADVTVLGIAFT
jgi:hypothetical protein